MAADGRRPRRVADAVRSYLAGQVQSKLGDPVLALSVLTSVEVSGDLGLAKVGVRHLAMESDPLARAALVKRFEQVSPRLRRGLGAHLGLRRVPELRFFYDTGHDAAERVEQLLREIASEPRGSTE